METSLSLSFRDLILLALFMLIRDGFPFFMRTVFPTWAQGKREQIEIENKTRERELELKREIAERELELKREIAERDRVMEERQTRSMEAMEQYIKDLSAFMAKTYGEMAILNSEARSYFQEGRQAIKQIAVMSAVKSPKPKKK